MLTQRCRVSARCSPEGATGRQDLANAAMEVLDHAVGLGMARRDEALLKVMFGTDPIEAMLAGRLTFSRGAEPVGEFLAVTGEDLGDLKVGGLEEVRQEVLGTGLRIAPGGSRHKLNGWRDRWRRTGNDTGPQPGNYGR